MRISIFNATHLAANRIPPITQNQIRCGAEGTGFTVALFTPTICGVAYFPSIFNYSWGTSLGVASLTVLLTDQRADLASIQSHADQRKRTQSWRLFQGSSQLQIWIRTLFQQSTRYLLFYFLFVFFCYHFYYSACIDRMNAEYWIHKFLFL